MTVLIVGSLKSSHLQNTKTFLSIQCSYGNYSNCLDRKAILGTYNLKLYTKHSTFFVTAGLSSLILSFQCPTGRGGTEITLCL